MIKYLGLYRIVAEKSANCTTWWFWSILVHVRNSFIAILFALSYSLLSLSLSLCLVSFIVDPFSSMELMLNPLLSPSFSLSIVGFCPPALV